MANFPTRSTNCHGLTRMCLGKSAKKRCTKGVHCSEIHLASHDNESSSPRSPTIAVKSWLYSYRHLHYIHHVSVAPSWCPQSWCIYILDNTIVHDLQRGLKVRPNQTVCIFLHFIRCSDESQQRQEKVQQVTTLVKSLLHWMRQDEVQQILTLRSTRQWTVAVPYPRIGSTLK